MQPHLDSQEPTVLYIQKIHSYPLNKKIVFSQAIYKNRQ